MEQKVVPVNAKMRALLTRKIRALQQFLPYKNNAPLVDVDVEYVNRLYDSTDESSDGDKTGHSFMGQSVEIFDMTEFNLAVADVESDICMSSNGDPEYSSTCASLED
ncbi:hypothetical protein OUZ56_024113 [Daphnia magna]|uniref:Uncharacterized protein n=1 Tax=Daphnia magna TaxID=35525 RepID=A0ABR0B063_9CRUS|nr:hypothetical protein OUZ56_024113 [Daphnia magna]